VQRQVGTVEGLLGGLNSRQLNQSNNIHITYKSDTGDDVLLRLEMLTGFTVMGQAVKCQEFEDLLRTNNVRKSFSSSKSVSATLETKTTDDIPAQIEKLAALRDKNIISAQEFETKKTQLLTKM